MVYDGGEIGECQYYSLQRERDFYGGCSKLTIATLSESNVRGKKSWKKKKKNDFENLDSFCDSLNNVVRFTTLGTLGLQRN